MKTRTNVKAGAPLVQPNCCFYPRLHKIELPV